MVFFCVHGNDAAVALSEYIAETVENFAILMNKKVKEMSLPNTNFITPHGLDEENHYTTAYELALITDYALNIKEIANIVKTKTYTVYINGNPKNINNTNELLGSLDGVYGVKTGFTNGANRCLVTAVKRNNMDIICVVLGADTKKYRGKDSIELIEYVFSNYEMVDIKSKVEEKFNDAAKNLKFNINKGVNNELKVRLEENDIDLYPVYKDNVKDIEIETNISEILNAPIKKNEVIGILNVKINSEIIYELEILTDSDICKKNVADYYEDLLYNMKDWLINGMKSKNINEISS